MYINSGDFFFPFLSKFVHLIQKLECHAKALALFTSWSCDLIDSHVTSSSEN